VKKVLLIAVALALGACSKVPVGNVGVKAYLLGGSKGVDTEELSPGRYWIGVNEELFLFPTFTQTYVWTKEPVDGDATDESLTFQSIEGMNVNADVGITYAVNPAKVTTLFQKYRKGIDEITDLYLRNIVKDAFVAEAGKLPIETVYKSKEKLLLDVEARVEKQVEQLGINVEKLYWAGGFRLPPQVTAAINASIEATQTAIRIQNEVAQTKAEAEKVVAKATGAAESVRLAAQAEADAISIKGKALRENPATIELSAIEKWNGVLPTITGSAAVPFVTVPQGK
jgi:regulator of protease activity HflC (stomatin/prohibitin superfamily)